MKNPFRFLHAFAAVALLSTCPVSNPNCPAATPRTPVHNFALGYKPDPAGVKDKQFSLHPVFAAGQIDPKSDFSADAPPVYDQGNIGSCVAHGNGAGFEIIWKRANKSYVPVSRLGLYYECRDKDGTVDQDAGSYIRTGVWCLTNVGVGCDACWPYDTSKFMQKPPASYYKDAKNYQIASAAKLDNTDGRSIRIALTAKFPVVFGAYVYAAIEDLTAADPFLPLAKGRPIGGHCMVIVGHDDNLTHKYADGKTLTGFYLVRNSWGTSYGNKGYIWIPYAYMHNGKICDDFWVIYTTKPKPAKKTALYELPALPRPGKTVKEAIVAGEVFAPSQIIR